MLIQIFTLLSTDMYMPALPAMAGYFDTSEATVNLTIIVFFIFSPVGTLLFGSLSDKYGRKPVLYFSTVAFAIASILCAFATTIWMLIGLRSLQALASGAAQVMGTALIKDLFSGKTRETVLICIQVSIIIGPIVAPVIGALVLIYFSWRATFVILATFGLLCLLMTFFVKEPLPLDKRTTEPAIKSFLRLGFVIKQKNFTVFLLVAHIFASLPFLVYLTASSYIYQDFFGLSPQEYSYFFGAAAGLSMVGLVFYKPLLRALSTRTITTLLMILAFCAGFGLLFFGGISPFIFFAFILLFYIVSAIARPYTMNSLLESQDSDIGSASAIMTCAFNLISIVGVVIALLIPGNDITGLGIVMMLGALISGGLWIYFLRSPLTMPGIKR
jgi:DHA1 family bicyclomycin/chloramphenicol resistance-like MFS transporter